MTDEKIKENRLRLQPRLTDYLRAEKIRADEDGTICPICGRYAQFFLYEWRCDSCGGHGDILDYAIYYNRSMSASEAVRHIHRMLRLKIADLDVIRGDELLDMEFDVRGWLAEGLLGPGLYLLAGASKIGKSWMVLALADRCSRGEPVWGARTQRTRVLYMSLEDTAERIQKRLALVAGGDVSGVSFVTECDMLGAGFEEQLVTYLEENRDTGLVIVDTLQRIRPAGREQYSYAADYETMTTLKRIADRFGITLLLVHHTRKEASEDSFNMISGTNGLMGSADGALVLHKNSRRGSEALLDVTGREIPDRRLRLRFDKSSLQWEYLGEGEGEGEEPEKDALMLAAAALVRRSGSWSGTASELAKELGCACGPTQLSRRLSVLGREYGLRVTRSHGKSRLMELTLLETDASDASDAVPGAESPGPPERRSVGAGDHFFAG